MNRGFPFLASLWATLAGQRLRLNCVLADARGAQRLGVQDFGLAAIFLQRPPGDFRQREPREPRILFERAVVGDHNGPLDRVLALIRHRASQAGNGVPGNVPGTPDDLLVL